MNTNCNNNKYKSIRVFGYFFILLTRFFKSLLVNAIFFITGFGCGFVYIANSVHEHAYEHTYYESFENINKYLNSKRAYDKLIDNELKKIKHKMSHDEHPECTHFPGNILIK